MTIRVLIADDQAMVRTGLSLILRPYEDIEIVGEAGDGHEAVEAARRLRPDVVLMDVRMPRMDGIEATRRLLAMGPHRPRVLVLTTFDLDEYVYDALRAGAGGFMLKDEPPERLLAGIRIVAAGDALLAPTVTRRLIEEFVRRPAPESFDGSGLADLTAREREILEQLARGRSNAEIAGELVLSRATVKTHVGNIFMKLDLRDRAQAVVFAYESGLVRAGRTNEPTAGA
ncbi:MAG TPA: response regulator transcription factor [Solirubrobacteraceae bacterium]|nr:response regulator transcription factor [Solirubrobacteraceae bacterium]